MTSASTVLALLPVLTSSGRGSYIMIPMVIPLLDGMLVPRVTLFVEPVLYSYRTEEKTFSMIEINIWHCYIQMWGESNDIPLIFSVSMGGFRCRFLSDAQVWRTALQWSTTAQTIRNMNGHEHSGAIY